MKYLRVNLNTIVQMLLVVMLLGFVTDAYASSDDNKGYLSDVYSSFSKDESKFVITSVSGSAKRVAQAPSSAPTPRHPAPSAHKPKPRHKSATGTRLPLTVRCLNALTAYGRKNYLDRITTGLERQRNGNTPVSEQIRRLTSSQRAAYEKCIKPAAKLKRSASKSGVAKSLVDLLQEQKDFAAPSVGFQIQPDGRHVPSKPAIIYATDATPRTQDFVLGGRNLTIRFTPVKYVADLGDGGPILEQTETPMPYPDAFKGHFYRKFTHSGTFTVTIETFWRVEWFNPAASTWVTEAQPLISTEQTGPQVVKPYQYVLTDDSEERHGR